MSRRAGRRKEETRVQMSEVRGRKDRDQWSEENTERPVTVTEGTNTLVGTEPERIIREAFKVLDSGASRGRIPALWDGAAASQIVAVLESVER
jgi:UDP-N-acetylglucosamine 2-epimerase